MLRTCVPNLCGNALAADSEHLGAKVDANGSLKRQHLGDRGWTNLATGTILIAQKPNEKLRLTYAALSNQNNCSGEQSDALPIHQSTMHLCMCNQSAQLRTLLERVCPVVSAGA